MNFIQLINNIQKRYYSWLHKRESENSVFLHAASFLHQFYQVN